MGFVVFLTRAVSKKTGLQRLLPSLCQDVRTLATQAKWQRQWSDQFGRRLEQQVAQPRIGTGQKNSLCAVAHRPGKPLVDGDSPTQSALSQTHRKTYQITALKSNTHTDRYNRKHYGIHRCFQDFSHSEYRAPYPEAAHARRCRGLSPPTDDGAGFVGSVGSSMVIWWRNGVSRKGTKLDWFCEQCVEEEVTPQMGHLPQE